MIEPKLVEAIGAVPFKTVAVEDLYKGQLALFSDRAVWVEERLGVYAVRGVYPFAAATNVEVHEGFLGKELTLTIDGKSTCFRKLLAADAEELCALFGGSKVPAPTAVLQEAAALPPSRPEPREPKQQPKQGRAKPQKQARSTQKRPIKELVKGLLKPALLVAALTILDRWLPRMFSGPAYWLAFAGLGAWGTPDRYPIYLRYGAGAAAISALFHFAMTTFAWHVPVLNLVLCYIVVTLGAFAAQPGLFDWRKLAGLGAGIALIDSFFLVGALGFDTVESFFSSFAAFMLFWGLISVIEQEPDLQRLLRPK